jgi:predicted acetyltransferase
MKAQFLCRDPGRLVDGELELVLLRTSPGDPVKRHVPGYEFEMRHVETGKAMGSIRLRIGPAVRLRCPGHIGYGVLKRFRGHRYAARSCLLLLPFAQSHGLKAVWLTVDPHNVPSRRTCEIIGARYMETVRVPKDHEMFKQGARYRRRYRLDLKRALARKRAGATG